MSYHSLALADYGLIGNETSSALVSRTGSIDWCCLPYLDSPSHFGSLLDETDGGKFQIAPVGDFRSEQRYLQRTHVLETLFETPFGRGVLTDWMPLDSQAASLPVIFRTLVMIEGRITWAVNCAPRFYYGGSPTQAECSGSSILFRGGMPGELARLTSSHPLSLAPEGESASTRFELEASKRARFSWIWGRTTGEARRLVAPGSRPPPLEPDPLPTVEAWHEIAHRCREDGCAFAGPWHDCISRASLTLRLLATRYSGAIAESVAAFSTSARSPHSILNARVASTRNAAFTLQALLALELKQEAHAYFDWLAQVLLRDGSDSLQTNYSLDGGPILYEREGGTLSLSGFSGARTLRHPSFTRKFQLDIYGQVILAAHSYQQAFGSLPEGLWVKIAELAEFVVQAWKRPDFGAGESRTRAEHFVMTKALCWAALDRACRLAEATGNECPAKWLSEKSIMHATLCSQGFDEERKTFVRAFGDAELDAGVLILPLLGFLPPDDPRIQGTLHALQANLAEGVLLYRAPAESGGTPDTASTVHSLQLVSCLALSGRTEEASDRLAEICTYATPLGMLGEQINPRTGEMSGLFPSSSVLVALVNAGLYVGLARGKKFNLSGVIGLPVAPHEFVKKRA